MRRTNATDGADPIADAVARLAKKRSDPRAREDLVAALTESFPDEAAVRRFVLAALVDPGASDEEIRASNRAMLLSIEDPEARRRVIERTDIEQYVAVSRAARDSDRAFLSLTALTSELCGAHRAGRPTSELLAQARELASRVTGPWAAVARALVEKCEELMVPAATP